MSGQSIRSAARSALAAGLLLLAPSAALRAQVPGVTRLSSVEGITEYQLKNGMRVLLFPDASKPTVTVNVTYLVGSRHEGYGETGMAHLLEHLMFKGSTNHPKIPQELTEHGARPNGTTWYDRTNYFETVPATDANLAWALSLEADRMVNSFIAKKDLESEFSVVRNEFEMGENSPPRVLAERVMSTAYLWHGYGRSTIGSKEDIETVPIDRLKSFYQRYYQPDNSILAVAGKFDEKSTLRQIVQKFGSIPTPVRSLAKGNLLYKTYTIEPVQDGERTVALRRIGDSPMIMAAYHIPAGGHPDFAAVDVLARILGDAPSGRLYKALVDTKLAASAGAYDYQLREPGILFATASLRNDGSLDSARTALLSTLDAAASQPVSVEEVTRAKTALLKSIELGLSNSEEVGLELSEWASMGDWRLLFLNRDRIEKVTPAEVQRVAALYLKPSNRTVGTFIPTAAPDRTTVPMVASFDQMVAGYTGRAVQQSGEAFDASPKNIDARTRHLALANGMQVTLLPKRTRGATVSGQILLRFGDLASLTNKGSAPSLVGAMLSRGTAALTRQQVRDSLDKLKGRVAISGSANSASITFQATHEHLSDVLALIASELKTPRFDAAEFDKLKQERLAGLEAARSEPQAKAPIVLQQRINPYPAGHPFAVNSVEDDIAAVSATTLEQVRQFHSSFYGASNADLVLVGDFDADSTITMVRRTFGDWKSPRPYTRIARHSTPVDSATIVIETPDKQNAILIAAQNLAIRDDNPDYPALALADFMLGGGTLNSRLATRLRQQEGLSYGAGSNLQVGPVDTAGTLMLYAIFNPQNVDRLTIGLQDEVRKMLTGGFTAAEVAAAKPSMIQQMEQSRANDPELVGLLLSRRFSGRTLAYDARLEAAINALTVEQVNAAVRKYIDPSKIVIVRGGDFKGKPPVKATP